VPILTAQALTDVFSWIGSVLMFGAFCSTASAIYLINVLLDINADRTHPLKRGRPFARSALSLPVGVMAALVLLTGGLCLAELGHVGWIIVLYAAMSIGYSFRLKELSLVDVYMLPGLYTIRLFGRGEATGHKLQAVAAGVFELPVPEPGTAQAGRGNDESG
jgi:4-hydroxybenzoate polyprenyltransferase